MAKSERRQLAEQIAAEKGIKVKSAFRYIQRSVAEEGKQQIKNPTFKGLSKTTKENLQDFVEIEKELKQQIADVEDAIDSERMITIEMFAEYDFANSDKRNDKPRRVNFQIASNEMNKLLREMKKGSKQTGDFLINTKDANFMGDSGKVKNIRHIKVK